MDHVLHKKKVPNGSGSIRSCIDDDCSKLHYMLCSAVLLTSSNYLMHVRPLSLVLVRGPALSDHAEIKLYWQPASVCFTALCH